MRGGVRGVEEDLFARISSSTALFSATQRARHAPLHLVVHLDGYYPRVHDGVRGGRSFRVRETLRAIPGGEHMWSKWRKIILHAFLFCNVMKNSVQHTV